MTAAVSTPAAATETAATPEATAIAAALATTEAPPAVESPAATADPGPSKLDLAAETLRKARKIAKAKRDADARADKETLRADTFAKELENERKETARAREERELLRKDPLAAIRKLGVSARDLATKAIDEGKPETLIARLQEQLEEEKQERIKLRAEIDERENSRNFRAAQEAFFANLTAETHPILHRLPRDTVMAMAKAEFDKARANGNSPTDKQVLAWCERLLSAPQVASAGTTTAKTNPTATTVPGTVAKDPATSRTVTAELAGRKYTLPAGYDDLSELDQKDALAKMLESMAGPTG